MKKETPIPVPVPGNQTPRPSVSRIKTSRPLVPSSTKSNLGPPPKPPQLEEGDFFIDRDGFCIKGYPSVPRVPEKRINELLNPDSLDNAKLKKETRDAAARVVTTRWLVSQVILYDLIPGVSPSNVEKMGDETLKVILQAAVANRRCEESRPMSQTERSMREKFNVMQEQWHLEELDWQARQAEATIEAEAAAKKAVSVSKEVNTVASGHEAAEKRWREATCVGKATLDLQRFLDEYFLRGHHGKDGHRVSDSAALVLDGFKNINKLTQLTSKHTYIYTRVFGRGKDQTVCIGRNHGVVLRHAERFAAKHASRFGNILQGKTKQERLQDNNMRWADLCIQHERWLRQIQADGATEGHAPTRPSKAVLKNAVGSYYMQCSYILGRFEKYDIPTLDIPIAKKTDKGKVLEADCQLGPMQGTMLIQQLDTAAIDEAAREVDSDSNSSDSGSESDSESGTEAEESDRLGKRSRPRGDQDGARKRLATGLDEEEAALQFVFRFCCRNMDKGGVIDPVPKTGVLTISDVNCTHFYAIIRVNRKNGQGHEQIPCVGYKLPGGPQRQAENWNKFSHEAARREEKKKRLASDKSPSVVDLTGQT